VSQELTSVGRGSQRQRGSKRPGEPPAAPRSEGGHQAEKSPPLSIFNTKSVKCDKIKPACLREVQHESRLLKLGKAKERSEKLVAWALENLPADDRGRVDAVSQADCASWLWFRRALEGPTAGDTRLTGGIFCQKLTCPACMIRKAARTVDAYTPKILTAWSDGAPDRRALFVTYTLPNGDDLAATWDHLHESLKRHGDAARQQRRRGAGPLASLAGGVIHIETKRGKGGQWHPHAHAIWLYDGRPDYDALRATWAQAVGCSAFLKIKHLNAQKALLDGREFAPGEFLACLRQGVMETLKYPMKFEGGKPADLWHVAKVLHDRRRLRPFGCLFGVEVSDDLADDQPDWSAVQSIELVYRYGGQGHFRLTKKPGPVASFDAWNAGR
jgi:hypothetical protein